ncbi:sensor histidine kinase [Desulfocurvibacter africanus]|uniref:sensor histidine kinase n=1 Tax=Desulfocurvibacter africanus TaxID=873 RepID=UPI00042442CD|nr:HAMP domain-containing sensor histidine kinase [Desulfocurvibacter africanus]
MTRASDHAASSQFRNPVFTDSFFGALLGFFLLHPLSMLIVGIPHEGNAFEMVHTGHALFNSMGFYFAAIGFASGLSSGILRRKVKIRNARLRENAALLEQVLSERESLLRILTHDLTNAIVSASGYLKIVARKGRTLPKEEIVENVAEVYQTLLHAHELVEFTRQIMAIESGKLDIPLSRQDIVPLVRDAVRLFCDKASQKKVTLRLDVPVGPVVAAVEPVTFKNSVIGNLVSNAVKFSLPDREVVVSVRRDTGQTQVTVANIGLPIPEEDRPRLFSPSERTTRPGTCGEPGTGFGLPLVDRFTRKMNGEVRMESEPTGEGDSAYRTVFEIILPHPGDEHGPGAM